MSAPNPLQPTTDPYAADSATSVETAPPARKRRLLPLIALGLAPVLVAGGAVAAHAHKSVDLEIDGETRTVSTFAGSVDGLLDEQGITIGNNDLLAPGPDSALSDGADIVVRTARQVTVDVNGEPQVVWTTALTQGDLVGSLFESGRDVTLAASRSFDRDGLNLPLVIDGEADVVADGETTRVQLDGEAYVKDALAAAGVELSPIDRVAVGSADDGTVQVTVTRVAAGERNETEAVDFSTVEREDGSLYVGEKKVVQEGAPGERTRTFATITVDGKEITSTLRSDEVTTKPVDRIIAVGTKERPAPKPQPAASPAASSAPAQRSAPSGGGAPTSGVWAQLAQCESGGNPSAVSPNGLYHGLYQFSVQTWQAMGGSGLPSQASPAEQTQRAQALQARSGWGQWPACAAKLGLI
ncbi:resuscitation-promoting factor [Georgenia sp. SUBG003]|uniref:G5 domain-containing protein n=1 Tax=Georgenia sp. SUBG003 TaxID=1497974 RepID=UPI00069449FF